VRARGGGEGVELRKDMLDLHINGSGALLDTSDDLVKLLEVETDLLRLGLGEGEGVDVAGELGSVGGELNGVGRDVDGEDRRVGETEGGETEDLGDCFVSCERRVAKVVLPVGRVVGGVIVVDC
jgi:hypothetical protein